MKLRSVAGMVRPGVGVGGRTMNVLTSSSKPLRGRSCGDVRNTTEHGSSSGRGSLAVGAGPASAPLRAAPRRLLATQQQRAGAAARHHAHEVDLRAEGAEDPGELHADVSRADDDDPLGEGGEVQGVVARDGKLLPWWGNGQAGEGRGRERPPQRARPRRIAGAHRERRERAGAGADAGGPRAGDVVGDDRAGARRDEDVGGGVARAVHVDGVRVDDLPAALDELRPCDDTISAAAQTAAGSERAALA